MRFRSQGLRARRSRVSPVTSLSRRSTVRLRQRGPARLAVSADMLAICELPARVTTRPTVTLRVI